MAGASTQVQLVSNALILLGDSPISSLTEERTGAVLGANLFEGTYQAMLASHRWRFATKTLQLSKLSTAPETDYTSAYSLPSDIIYLIKTDTQNYDIYGSEVHTNSDTLQIDYIYRVAEDKLPAYFQKALEYNLAAQFAVPLTGDIDKGSYYAKLFNNEVRKARYADSTQHPQDSFADSPYTEVRY